VAGRHLRFGVLEGLPACGEQDEIFRRAFFFFVQERAAVFFVAGNVCAVDRKAGVTRASPRGLREAQKL
jgi:hypothetical protein